MRPGPPNFFMSLQKWHSPHSDRRQALHFRHRVRRRRAPAPAPLLDDIGYVPLQLLSGLQEGEKKNIERPADELTQASGGGKGRRKTAVSASERKPNAKMLLGKGGEQDISLCHTEHRKMPYAQPDHCSV